MNSYYNPVSGTTGITYGPNGSADTFYGEPLSVVVACDLGRRIISTRGGQTLWVKDFPDTWPRALCLFQNMIFFAEGNRVFACNPETGYEYYSRTLNGVINSLDVREESGTTYLTAGYDSSGVGTVEIYTINGANFNLFHTNSFPASHPRGGYYINGWLFVSDTFGHEVYAVDVAANSKRASRSFYFPNTIEPDGGSVVIVAAEHENRIIRWEYSGAGRLMIHSAPVPLFSNISNSATNIIDNQHVTESSDTSYTPRKSICAKEYSGIDTLYSPNSARYYGDDLLISDTDNHRVILIRDGIVVSEIEGFNNPVNAVMF